MLKEENITETQVRRRTILAFACFIIFIAAAVFAWKWLYRQPPVAATVKPLRTVLDANESVFLNIFSNQHLAKTYKTSDVVPRVRINGMLGLRTAFEPAEWKLKVAKSAGDTLFISLEELKSLPKTEIIFDFKCIEGWSQVTHWGGVRFSDFINHYNLDEQSRLRFTGMSTPDEEYYVGIDNKSMMHPQTLLCYEMNGKPLLPDHGYPLRLIIPVKYGIKHLKRIGTMHFSDVRPPDYWYERGYDYYSGL